MDDTLLDDLYGAYQVDPTPGKLGAVVKKLQPTINYSLNNIGAADDPYLRSEAKLIAADAVKNYDPASGATLPTWTTQQLMRMRRLKRQSQSVMNVPDRSQLDAMTLFKAEQEFLDEHGRDPDVIELADRAKIPVKRIEKVRAHMRKTPTQDAVGESFAPNETDFSAESLDYVYRDADYTDRKILEMKIGYGGSDMFEPAEVARRLKLTPTQLSRRSARLSMKIQNLENRLTRISSE